MANKTDAGNGSYGICRVIDASRSPSPDPKRSAKPTSTKSNQVKQYQKILDSINRHVSAFNTFLAADRHLMNVSLERPETAAWIEDRPWGGDTWPSKDSYGVYFLVGHRRDAPDDHGLYVGKASLKQIGFRTWSHLKPGKGSGRYTKKAPDGSVFCLQMLLAIPMPSDQMRSFASALEEHLITALRGECYLLNRVGNK